MAVPAIAVTRPVCFAQAGLQSVCSQDQSGNDSPSGMQLPSGCRIAPGIRAFAIGDIHGRVDLLQQAMAKVDADLRGRPVPKSMRIFLGDYIDRGPDSPGVIDA